MFVATMSTATTNWGVYVNGNNSYFGGALKTVGPVYINQETPLAELHVTGYVGSTDMRGIYSDGTYGTATAHVVQIETAHPLADTKAVAMFDAKGSVTGAGAVDHMVGFQSRPTYEGTATLGICYDFLASAQLTGAGTTATRYGLQVADANLTAGALTTQYGVYIATLDAATTNWGLYVNENNSYMGGSLVMAEMTAPGAPSANSLVLYAVDNGAGKTQLMVRFPSGVAQQIAIEA
jgi:hypothetical protein